MQAAALRSSGKRAAGSGTSQCKGPAVGMSLVSLRDSREASGLREAKAGTGRALEAGERLDGKLLPDINQGARSI